MGGYLDFFGGWDSRVSTATLVHTLAACGYLAGAVLLRMVFLRRNGEPPPGRVAQSNSSVEK